MRIGGGCTCRVVRFAAARRDKLSLGKYYEKSQMKSTGRVGDWLGDIPKSGRQAGEQRAPAARERVGEAPEMTG